VPRFELFLGVMEFGMACWAHNQNIFSAQVSRISSRQFIDVVRFDVHAAGFRRKGSDTADLTIRTYQGNQGLSHLRRPIELRR
jgi:hypothetical protein